MLSEPAPGEPPTCVILHTPQGIAACIAIPPIWVHAGTWDGCAFSMRPTRTLWGSSELPSYQSPAVPWHRWRPPPPIPGGMAFLSKRYERSGWRSAAM
jgi:hypothetical protein